MTGSIRLPLPGRNHHKSTLYLQDTLSQTKTSHNGGTVPVFLTFFQHRLHRFSHDPRYPVTKRSEVLEVQAGCLFLQVLRVLLQESVQDLKFSMRLISFGVVVALLVGEVAVADTLTAMAFSLTSSKNILISARC